MSHPQDSVNRTYLPLAGGTMTGNLVNYTSTDTTTTTASSGSSYTINKALSDIFDITLTADCTFTFSNIPASNTTTFVTILRQDSTGSRTVTWPAAVTWVKGSAPTLNTAANAVDIFTFLTDDAGTVVYGFTTGTEPLTIQAYETVQNNTTPVTQRTILNFPNGDLVATDDSGNSSTDITTASGISGWSGFASSGMLAETATNTYAARTITGTASQIDVSNGSGVSGNPTISIDSGYVGQTSITTLGTIATGTWNGSVVGPTYGGTGVNNGVYSITLGGSVLTAGTFTTSGANALTLTTTGPTNITLPTTGTLVTSTVTSLPDLATVGTIGTGVWQGTVVGATYGGTGVNNGASTITLAGDLVTSGANSLTLTTTGPTNVTLPTTGTLVTSTVTSLPDLATVGTIGTGVWQGTVIGSTYGGTGVNNGSFTITLGGSVVTSGTFTTSGANPLTLTTTGSTNVTLPLSGTLITNAVTTLSSLVSIGTITTGVWNGTVIGATYGGTGVNNGSNTITLAGSLTTSGANPLTLTTSGTTNVTLPTSGTLVNTGVTTLSSLATVGTVTSGTWSSNLQDYTESLVSTSSAGSSYAMNLANGNVFSIELTANCTLSFSNVPGSNVVSVTIAIVQGGSGSYTVTWPTGTIWPGGTAPTLTTTVGHVDVITMLTMNNGTTWRAFTAGQNFAS